MPEFRFQIKDSSGRVRSGKTAAPNKEEARARIEQAGFVVVELFENIDVAASVKIQEGGGAYTGKSYRSLRAEPLELEPLWSERFASLIPRGQSATVILLALAILGLGGGLWRSYGGSSGRSQTPEVQPKMVNVTLDAQVTLPDGAFVSDLNLAVNFPEIPYQVGKRWTDLQHPSKDRALIKLNFATAVLPKTCVLSAKLGQGKEIRSEPLKIRDGQANLQVKLSLPKS